MIIEPKIGVSGVKLGARPGEVDAVLGEPDVIAPYEDDETEWAYAKRGLFVYFSLGSDPIVKSILITAPTATLFGARVVGLSEKEFLALLAGHGVTARETDHSDESDKFLEVSGLGLWVATEDGQVASVICEHRAA